MNDPHPQEWDVPILITPHPRIYDPGGKINRASVYGCTHVRPTGLCPPPPIGTHSSTPIPPYSDNVYELDPMDGLTLTSLSFVRKYISTLENTSVLLFKV